MRRRERELLLSLGTSYVVVLELIMKRKDKARLLRGRPERVKRKTKPSYLGRQVSVYVPVTLGTSQPILLVW